MNKPLTRRQRFLMNAAGLIAAILYCILFFVLIMMGLSGRLN